MRDRGEDASLAKNEPLRMPLPARPEADTRDARFQPGLTSHLRRYAVLGMATLMVASLIVLGREHPTAHRYDLLFLALVLLGAYLEEMAGALAISGLGLVAVMAGYALGWLELKSATGDLIGLAVVFTIAGIWCHDREESRRRIHGVLAHKQHDLRAIQERLERLQGQLETTEQQLKSLTKIYEVAKKLSGTLDLNALLDEAGLTAAKIFSGYAAPAVANRVRLAFYLPDEKTGTFKRQAAGGHGFSDQGFPEGLLPEDLQRAMGGSFSSWLVHDASADSRFQWMAAMTPFRSLVVIPLVTQETTAGIMILASVNPGEFSAGDFYQAEVLGKQIVLALRKCLLYHKVEMLSFTDTQTGLYVHRFFQDRLRIEIHRAERYRQFLSLIMLDMDHFKRVNDEHGHQAGDMVLVEAASRIRDMAGPTAMVARYGGEEFAVLLPNTPKARALQIGTAINAAMKAAPVGVEGKRLTVTVSGGISTYPEDALDRESLIATADAALYEAKRNGRDLVMAHEGAAGHEGMG